MKVCVATAAIALVSVPALSQSVRTGVSNPEPVVITADEGTGAGQAGSSSAKAKPSAAVPLTARPSGSATGSGGEVYGAYVPYRGNAAMTTTSESVAVADPDAAIVTTVEDVPGEVREGTLLRARLKQVLSTVSTVSGSTFMAELSEPVEKGGRVVLPVGAVIEGRVTEVHGGRRISGAATLHLEPKTVTLPDGTHYNIHAQLIDTDQAAHTKIDREGTLTRRDHPRETLAAMGLATGGAATAGAMIGGGVGAAVGAGIGAGAGTILWLKQDRQAVLPQDTLLVFSLTTPMPVMPVSNTPMSMVATPRTVTANSGGSIVE